MSALRRAYDATAADLPSHDLIEGMQTGERLTYRPDRALLELKALDNHIMHALADLEAGEAALRAVPESNVAKSTATEDRAAQRMRDQVERLTRGTDALQWILRSEAKTN